MKRNFKNHTFFFKISTYIDDDFTDKPNDYSFQIILTRIVVKKIINTLIVGKVLYIRVLKRNSRCFELYYYEFFVLCFVLFPFLLKHFLYFYFTSIHNILMRSATDRNNEKYFNNNNNEIFIFVH